jgi:Protoheme ferro-lyase (ferrochelatase)
MEDKNMSPLRYFTESRAEKLSQHIGNEKLIVDFAVRYGNPKYKK